MAKVATTMENERQLAGGLIGLVAGAVLLILAVWMFALFLGENLAVVHMRHKTQGVSEQAAAIVRKFSAASIDKAARTELARLMKYREVERIDIADAAGRIIWSSDPSGLNGRISIDSEALAGANGLDLDVRKRTNLSENQFFARSLAVIGDDGRTTGLVALEMDMTGLVAWYRRISILVAKVITTVLSAAFLVMGFMLFGKYRERKKAETRLEKLRRQNEEEQKKINELNAQLANLNEDMARLNRKLAEAMGQDGAPRRGEAAEKVPGSRSQV